MVHVAGHAGDTAVRQGWIFWGEFCFPPGQNIDRVRFPLIVALVAGGADNHAGEFFICQWDMFLCQLGRLA